MLALSGCAIPQQGQVASSDACEDRGYQPGTSEYLDCWNYVTRTNQIDEAQRQSNFNSSMNLFLNSLQPQQRTYACTNAWGQLTTCIQ